MERVRLLVCSPQETVADYVRANVAAESMEVRWVPPGYRGLRIVSEWCADVALVECMPEVRDRACLQVEMLKRLCPNIRIIVHTETSVPEDGELVEQGLFFYAAFPVGPELIRVIEAAARRHRRGRS